MAIYSCMPPENWSRTEMTEEEKKEEEEGSCVV
jgi:hypothetical protein